MALEDVLQWAGGSGRFQILTVALCTAISVLAMSHDTMENFTAGIPDHRCYVPLLDSPNSEANTTANLSTEALLRVSIPMGANQKPEQCRRFRQTQWQLLDPSVSEVNRTEPDTEPCLDGWTYDRSVFTSTIITKWDLVCDYQAFKYLAQAITLTGYLLGIAVSGVLSDRFGRKPLLVSSCLAYGVLSVCCVFVPIFSIYCILRFLSSASMAAVQSNSFVLALEGTTLNWKPTVITVYSLSMSAGQIFLGGIAYVFRDWHMIQLAIGLPFFILFLFVCCITESVRWLIVTGRAQQALKELRKIAYVNGKKDVAQSLTAEILISKMEEDMPLTRKHFTLKQIVVNPTLRRSLLCMSTVWFSLLFSSFGLMLDVQNLGKDIFMTQFLLGAVEFSIRLPTFLVIRHVSRRPSLCILAVVYGSSLILTVFVPKEMHTLRLSMFVLARVCLAAFVSIGIAFFSELSPTVLRSTIQGILQIAARTGGIFSALVLITRQYFVHLPTILYGVFSIPVSVCIFFLPETINLPLPDTIQDMESRDRFRKKSMRQKQGRDLLETTEC